MKCKGTRQLKKATSQEVGFVDLTSTFWSATPGYTCTGRVSSVRATAGSQRASSAERAACEGCGGQGACHLLPLTAWVLSNAKWLCWENKLLTTEFKLFSGVPQAKV